MAAVTASLHCSKKLAIILLYCCPLKNCYCCFAAIAIAIAGGGNEKKNQ